MRIFSSFFLRIVKCNYTLHNTIFNPDVFLISKLPLDNKRLFEEDQEDEFDSADRRTAHPCCFCCVKLRGCILW